MNEVNSLSCHQSINEHFQNIIYLTSNIRDYQFYFNFPSVETYVTYRATKFIYIYSAVVNVLCETFAPVALHQLLSTQFAHEYYLYINF